MDECNQLYVLDTGYIGNNYTCPAQILMFDLLTDRLLKRIKIPDNVAQNKQGVGTLVTPVIETKGTDCSLQNLFMADVNGHGLVIYNNDRFFRLEAQIFEPEQAQSNVSIAGVQFELADSIMGMAITPRTFRGEGRDLILRPFASRAVHTADTRVLSRSTFGDTINYKSAPDMLPSQATTMGISSHGTLFFGLTQEIAIGCWNRYRNMTRDNIEIAVQDSDRLQFLSGLKVLPKSRTKGQEEVWALSNRLQTIMTGTTNYNEINFRVVRSTVSELISGTRCHPPI
ncbi:major royal jelly protein 1-like [Phymastichus coffea]|uniref:major royal jelly protein 1-like n=1 Tax=Phymastichus coffea TaxID=108790 RepID=UPI00273C3CF8|nr:major royal jelly protein 1-like [Phymastichus coffea]